MPGSDLSLSSSDGAPFVIGLPGKQIKIGTSQSTRNQSFSTDDGLASSQSSMAARRGPAISLDTSVSSYKSKTPQQILPVPSLRGLSERRKKSVNLPQPLNLHKDLSPYDRYVPITLKQSTSTDTQHDSLTHTKSTIKTPAITITPTSRGSVISPRSTVFSSGGGRPRASSSLHSKAFYRMISPKYKPKTVSDASFHCRGIDEESKPSDEGTTARRRSRSESTVFEEGEPHSPRTAEREPLTAASSKSRYTLFSAGSGSTSAGWWDLLKSPFLRQSNYLTSIIERDLRSSTPEVPMLTDAAPMPETDKIATDEITPLIQEFKERHVLMYGEAAKYFDPSFNLDTPKPRSSLDPITHGELRELSRQAIEAGFLAEITSAVEPDSATTEIEDSPIMKHVEARDFTKDDLPTPKAANAAREVPHLKVHPAPPMSASPTSTIFSPEVGIASTATVQSARVVSHVSSLSSNHSTPRIPAQAPVAEAPPDTIEASKPHLDPPPSFFADKSSAAFSKFSRAPASTTFSDVGEDARRADAFYYLTGQHPTPRSNAALTKQAQYETPPPLPPAPIIINNEYAPRGRSGPEETEVAKEKTEEVPRFSPPPRQSLKRWRTPSPDSPGLREKGADSSNRRPNPFAFISRIWSSASPHSRTRFLLFGGIAFALFLIILLIVLLCLFVVQKHVDMPVQASWLNLTGYPPLPTGVMTVANANNTASTGRCVQPSSIWTCNPPAGLAPANSDAAASLPSLRLEIRFRNGTVARNMTQLARRDEFSSLLYTPDPSPPSAADRAFLGNTTDGVSGPNYAGEPTPFFISLLPTNHTQPLVVAASLGATANSTNQTVAVYPTITTPLPSPLRAANGSAYPGALFPLPSAQPLLLYNRGADDEHYAFYTYFDRTALVALPADSPTTSVVTASSISESSPPAAPPANAQCTFAQSRFVVRIWTRRPAAGSLPSGRNTSSAFDWDGPGSMPYAVSVALDRHGGDARRKGAFCYGVDGAGFVNATQQIVLREDRGAGGVWINGMDSPFTPPHAGWDAVDGGTGGCACAWDNL